jgi:hypothetical protein
MKSLVAPLAVALAMSTLVSTAAAQPSVATVGPTPPALQAIRFAHVADRMPAPAFSCPWRPAPQLAGAGVGVPLTAASVAGSGLVVALFGAGVAGRSVRRAPRLA